jgi:hypothetical protein
MHDMICALAIKLLVVSDLFNLDMVNLATKDFWWYT